MRKLLIVETIQEGDIVVVKGINSPKMLVNKIFKNETDELHECQCVCWQGTGWSVMVFCAASLEKVKEELYT